MMKRTFRWLRGGVGVLAWLVVSCGAAVGPRPGSSTAVPSTDLVPGPFVTGVWNPEDLIRVPNTPWVLVSAMKSERAPGALLAVDVRYPTESLSLWPRPAPSAAPGDSAPVFAPHGIDVRPIGDGKFELLVVDHGGGEFIDRFSLEARGDDAPVIRFVGRVVLPAGTSANGVAATADGGFVMTSMFDPRDSDFVAKFAAARPTGSVWRWSEAAGWTELPTPRLSGANGIIVTRDGKHVVVAEWAGRRLWRIPLASDATDRPRSVAVPFLPDNLRWTHAGDLLLAGQTTAPEELFGCEPERCPKGFVVARVDADILSMTPILRGDDASAAKSGFLAATGAIQVGETIWVGSFMGKSLGCYEPRTPVERTAALQPTRCFRPAR
ncbi:hypothetical protein AKJ09_10674 [Labilithrix luteola]|uniref:Uncharacterized protein n=1 Tax=Labilithrix luteola TaxID=1391654 RepID=A0A0K1QE13_9BACT|nr:hypothetical protein [Labilithrix luteola]AKV04011.1 hypothetical protein AKJ09_10674 [Labilithrix luteola]